ncbi:MAG TPA: serine/threonine-protein kinase [Labilithrix sp.]|jgi:serine/threonine-protein kinase
MSVPELTTRTSDARAFARILRAALKCEVLTLDVESSPKAGGAHMLHVILETPPEKAVWLLAEVLSPAGAARVDIRLQPRSRNQAAQLYALAQIVGGSIFPPEDAPPSVRVYSQPPPALEPSTLSLTGTIPLTHRIRRVEELADPLLGRVLAGKHRIDELAGAGAVGVVYRGMQIDLELPVAIKILHEEVRADPTAVARFKAEAKSAARLEHPNIARVLDAGEEPDGLLYLVMELAEGLTLESELAALGRIESKRAIAIAWQVAGALACAHAAGIVHRDIKPENLMLTRGLDVDGVPGEIVKVCDFGVAKAEAAVGHTATGALVGSPVYMSPEQARGERPEPRSDLYSLGVVLFEITTGRLPFDGAVLAEILAKQIAEPPPRPTSIDPAYDPKLEALVLSLLAKKPQDRPESARELRSLLSSLEPNPSKAAVP